MILVRFIFVIAPSLIFYFFLFYVVTDEVNIKKINIFCFFKDDFVCRSSLTSFSSENHEGND